MAKLLGVQSSAWEVNARLHAAICSCNCNLSINSNSSCSESIWRIDMKGTCGSMAEIDEDAETRIVCALHQYCYRDQIKEIEKGNGREVVKRKQTWARKTWRDEMRGGGEGGTLYWKGTSCDRARGCRLVWPGYEQKCDAGLGDESGEL